MFPRFLFDKPEEVTTDEHGVVIDDMAKPADEEAGKKGLTPTHTAASERVGEVLPGFEKRTVVQKLYLWSYQPEDKTTYWQYFKRLVRTMLLDGCMTDTTQAFFPLRLPKCRLGAYDQCCEMVY